MYKGGAGGYTFYVRGGEQVIRQRKNNSNYGDTASRTYAQMIRRIRWGNLVNVFKAIKLWQRKAYDSKLAGQTDYNWFMKLNVNSAIVGTSKEMNESGCAIIEPYQVSVGSLPPINNSVAGSGNNYVTDIVLSSAITGSTTVGQLSVDILNNNPQYQEGDNIAFIFFRNWLTSRTEWPYAASIYTEITLDTTSTKLLSTIVNLGSRLSKSTGNFLQASFASTGLYDVTHEVGFVAIHTRRSTNQLLVSSQNIVMNDSSLIAQFSGDEWDAQCIASYGLSDQAPLDPGSGGGDSDAAVTSFNVLLTGRGDSSVGSGWYRMQPGTYHLTANPNAWSVEGIADASNAVVINGTSSPGVQSTVLAKMTVAQFTTNEGLGSLEFTVPDGAPYVRLYFRGAADEGVIFSAS